MTEIQLELLIWVYIAGVAYWMYVNQVNFPNNKWWMSLLHSLVMAVMTLPVIPAFMSWPIHWLIVRLIGERRFLGCSRYMKLAIYVSGALPLYALILYIAFF